MMTISRRKFNVDRYLDEQLAGQRRTNIWETLHDRYRSMTISDAQHEMHVTVGVRPVEAPKPEPHPFGRWGRLNDAIERWLDRTDWVRVDIWLGSICGWFLSGAALYFICSVAEAWLSGAIQRIVR